MRVFEDRAMAGFKSVGAVGKSIEALLNVAFAEPPVPVTGRVTHAALIRTDDLELSPGSAISPTPALSILLYRVDFNKTMRPSWSAVGSLDGHSHLPLDLHFLLTAWADNAEDEHQIIGRAMQALETVGALSGPLLYPSGEWEPGEAVQLYLEDMATDDLMRTFDSLQCDFRLSVPYIARIVMVSGSIVPDGAQGATPVTVPPPDATRVVVGVEPA
jgi:Pvc16 N-terminal domain